MPIATIKMRYNYYTIHIPQDCESDADERARLAISQARANARTYVVPCSWVVVKDDGEHVRVCRKSTRRVDE